MQANLLPGRENAFLPAQQFRIASLTVSLPHVHIYARIGENFTTAPTLMAPRVPGSEYQSSFRRLIVIFVLDFDAFDDSVLPLPGEMHINRRADLDASLNFV